MSCVCALSIAPTIFLHNEFASHTDSIEKSPGHAEQHIGNDLFNCQCDHLVGESPFTEAVIFRLTFSPQIFAVPKTQQQAHVVSCQTIFYSLRGPPVV